MLRAYTFSFRVTHNIRIFETLELLLSLNLFMTKFYIILLLYLKISKIQNYFFIYNLNILMLIAPKL